MYLFSITVNIDDSEKEQWMKWLTTKLNPILENKDLVHDFRVLKVLSEEPQQGTNYSFQYHISNLEKIEQFEELYDREVAVEMYRFYKEKFVEFRTRLELVNWK